MSSPGLRIGTSLYGVTRIRRKGVKDASENIEDLNQGRWIR